MSYDLMVFDPKAAPVDRDEFMIWFKQQVEWTEDHSYEDPEVTTPQLKAWFMDMIEKYPAMNGPFASEDDDDDEKLTDYCIGSKLIYAGFAWSEATDAYNEVGLLAQKHKLGFFDVSAKDCAVYLPDKNGNLICAHTG